MKIKIIFVVFISLLIAAGCSNTSEIPEKGTARATSDGTVAARSRQGEDTWNKICKNCHTRSRLEGKTADDIKRALKTQRMMAGLKDTLSDEDIAGVVEFLKAGTAKNIYSFISAETCGGCHTGHEKQWTMSLHAMAHTEPVYDRYFIKASNDSNGELQVFCAKCHTPIAVYNGNIPFKHKLNSPSDTNVSAIESDGVQCDFCHIIKGYTALNNSNYVMDLSDVKRGPYDDAVSPFHETAFSEIHANAQLCGTCHNVNHPANGIVLESTYTEWEESEYAKEGTTCLDCHMTEGSEPGGKQPGRAAAAGPLREHVSSHYFVGPNMMFCGAEDKQDICGRSRELLKRAAKVSIGEPVSTGGDLVVPVKVTNSGAGHYIPTGVAEIRNVWLEATATDKNGTEIFASGRLDENGNILAGSIVYSVDVKDAGGNITTQFWNTVEKVRDYRIPPRGTLTEKFRFKGNRDAASGITFRVALKYRSVSPGGLAEVGAPPDLVDVPVITIASDERKITTQ